QLRGLERGPGALEDPGARLALQEEGRHRRPHRVAGVHHPAHRQPLAVRRRRRSVGRRRGKAVGGTDMKIRWLIALVALLGASCRTKQNSALVVTKVVLGEISGTSCKYVPGSGEVVFANIDPATHSRGYR